jgi:hypothetical protein
MGEQHFEVIFRGDVELGRSVVEVKEGLAKLFNADVSRIEQMFSGKPVVIKANLDENTALNYQASLKAVGALVDIRSSESIDASSKLLDQTAVAHVSSEKVNAPSDTEKMVDFDFDVAPIGADMLPTEHKKDYTPADVDTSHLSVSDIGSDVLDEKDKRSYEESDVDISHLSITAIGNVE